MEEEKHFIVVWLDFSLLLSLCLWTQCFSGVSSHLVGTGWLE